MKFPGPIGIFVGSACSRRSRHVRFAPKADMRELTRYVCLVPMVMRALLVALAGESRSISPPSLEIARRMMAGFEPAIPSSRTRCHYQKAAARIACSSLTGEALLTGTSGRRVYQPPPRLMHQSTCHVTCYRKESVAGGFKPPQCNLPWSALRSLGLSSSPCFVGSPEWERTPLTWSRLGGKAARWRSRRLRQLGKSSQPIETKRADLAPVGKIAA